MSLFSSNLTHRAGYLGVITSYFTSHPLAYFRSRTMSQTAEGSFHHDDWFQNVYGDFRYNHVVGFLDGQLYTQVPRFDISQATYKFDNHLDLAGDFEGYVGPFSFHITSKGRPNVTISGPLDLPLNYQFEISGRTWFR
jgi:hypothetical protein